MGYDPVSLEMQISSLEFELGISRKRSAELEDRIAGLETERDRRQREVEDWQAYIDRELAGVP